MSMVKNPRNCWGMPLWDDQVHAVGSRAVFSRVLALVKFLMKILWYWLKGMVLTDVLGSTLMWRGLLPLHVTIWKVVWNDVWPSEVVSVISLPS